VNKAVEKLFGVHSGVQKENSDNLILT